jgi:hypothetical protein
MSRFLLAILRNCGAAIAISVFFAAASGSSHPHPPGAVGALASVAARYPEAIAPAQMKSGCDQAVYRVCRLVDAGQERSERASPHENSLRITR